jgi:hypothetical protein
MAFAAPGVVPLVGGLAEETPSLLSLLQSLFLVAFQGGCCFYFGGDLVVTFVSVEFFFLSFDCTWLILY